MKVKVNHTGVHIDPETNEHYFYTANEVVDLPQELLEALGEDSYKVMEEKPAPKKEEVKKDK